MLRRWWGNTGRRRERGLRTTPTSTSSRACRARRCRRTHNTVRPPRSIRPRRAIRGPSRRVEGGCESWLILLRNGAWPSPKLHHPHPRVIVPRAAGALAVDRIPPGTPEGHEVRVGAAVEGGDGAPPEERVIVRPCNGALGQDARPRDLLEPLHPHTHHVESDSRRPPGHVERRAPAEGALTPLKERLPEPPPDAVTGVVAHQVSIGAEHSRPSNHLREDVAQRGPRLADPESIARGSVGTAERGIGGVSVLIEDDPVDLPGRAVFRVAPHAVQRLRSHHPPGLRLLAR